MNHLLTWDLIGDIILFFFFRFVRCKCHSPPSKTMTHGFTPYPSEQYHAPIEHRHSHLSSAKPHWAKPCQTVTPYPSERCHSELRIVAHTTLSYAIGPIGDGAAYWATPWYNKSCHTEPYLDTVIRATPRWASQWCNKSCHTLLSNAIPHWAMPRYKKIVPHSSGQCLISVIVRYLSIFWKRFWKFPVETYYDALSTIGRLVINVYGSLM